MPSDIIDKTSERIYAVQTSLTGTAAVLGVSTQDLTELVIQADPDNTVDILIGSSSVQCWKMEPGDQFNCPIKNPALLYGKWLSSGTAVCNLIGRSSS